ncbi:speckle-type POZ protein-like isoform X1 [Leptopilina heterotoma]|uniref:speckle-type POZ protein-like isoform X1 n=1 Tax=Leptopilina heterotoma TaxID=63436 RepID=UPI001CAA0BE5|nr:speckle-type POZ protein-like isoform X1 [Leptopilina heterotoma]XP_043464513.1 speckle-type POZ protein-like isoform X1 [Leptopilina heterotoma]
MAVGMYFSDVLREIGESTDILEREYINYVGIITPAEKVKSKPYAIKIQFQTNPEFSFYLILEEIDGNEFSSSIKFSVTLQNKHYHITLHQIHTLSGIPITDTINVADVTKGSTYKFKKQFSLPDVPKNIHILCKVVEIEEMPVKIDIPKNLMSTKCLSLYEEKKLSDFKIICQGQEFCVHKTILVCQSDVFQAMFENPMKESREDALTISDFEPNIVETMIRYLYSDEMTESLSEDEFKQLLLIANKYNLEKLEKICFKETLKLIKTFEQALDLIIFAESHNFVDMKNFVIQFMRENKNTFM